MRYSIYIPIFFALLISACSPPEKAVHDSRSTIEQATTSDEWISFNINEAVYFKFEKHETEWSGELTVYTLNADGQKVVQSEYISAQDSSWNEFDLFVDFLNIYEIPPQYEIDGWVPDSGQLPRRVYSFEVYDGDTAHSFSYQDPEKGIRDFWQAQNLLTFITFVQNDLRWVEKKNIE